VYNGAGVQGTVAMLELARNQGFRQPSQIFNYRVCSTSVQSTFSVLLPKPRLLRGVGLLQEEVGVPCC
jgi:hypothetical protein